MTLAQENLILSLIGTEPDGLKPIEVQKLMFVYSRLEETVPSYEFIPFKQGCYSTTIAQDVRKLEGKRLLRGDKPENKDKLKKSEVSGLESEKALRGCYSRVSGNNIFFM